MFYTSIKYFVVSVDKKYTGISFNIIKQILWQAKTISLVCRYKFKQQIIVSLISGHVDTQFKFKIKVIINQICTEYAW